MRYLTNLYDPTRLDALGQIERIPGETWTEAREHYREWLHGKIIGEPQATETYTVEQLKAMHMVGIYAKDDPPARP
jgi:hypothetical protein